MVTYSSPTNVPVNALDLFMMEESEVYGITEIQESSALTIHAVLMNDDVAYTSMFIAWYLELFNNKSLPKYILAWFYNENMNALLWEPFNKKI